MYIMSTKIKKEKVTPTRKKSVLPLKLKIEMLDRIRVGESFASIARSFNVNESTVRSIKKSEDKIRTSIASTSLSAKIVRDPAVEKMEVALSLWIEDRNKKGIPMNGPLVREQAKRLYALFKEAGSECKNEGFQASEGWFSKFKARQSLRSVKAVGEPVSTDITATESYPETFSKYVTDVGYKPEQVFNADETILFWKRLPNKILIPKDESASCLKTANDKVSLLLCSNAAGDYVMKPLMVYKMLNPRSLKNQNKEHLPVYWRANKKALVTSDIFRDWFLNCFVPEVEIYLKKKDLDFNAVLVLYNTHSHPYELETMHPYIKVIFLRPNTTSSLQPMDQGIIQTFKLNYIRRTFKNILDSMGSNTDMNVMQCFMKKFNIAKCIVNIKESLEDLKPYTLKFCWKKLWPNLVVENDEFFMCVQTQSLIANIVEIANEIGRDGFEHITSNDIQELVESQYEDLNETDLEEMLNPLPIKEEPSTSDEKVTFSLKNLSEGLRMVNELCDYFVKNDPSMERSISFKRQILNAASEYQAELKELLKSRKQFKITVQSSNKHDV